MAWIIDPNLGSGIFAIPSVAPFPTGGGHEILNLVGGGAVYNDSVNALNKEVSIDYASYKSNFNNGRWFFGLIGRRQSSGDFYYGAAAIRSGGTPSAYAIYKYTASSNTLTQLAFIQNNDNGAVGSDVVNGSTTSYNLSFRLHGPNLCVLYNNQPRVSVHDTSIALAGNPGIAANLQFVDSIASNAIADNFLVRSIPL